MIIMIASIQSSFTT